MKNLCLIYVTCPSLDEAKNIGQHLLLKNLCACVNILPQMYSLYFWPQKPQIEKSQEVILLLKSQKHLFSDIEKEIESIHSYEIPCIFSIPIENVSSKYLAWIEGQLP